ncbi:sulfotransferase [Desulfovibrio sp. JC010]|uniref:sulfotransferase family protein n=1 Tax=Desulfovibrio sp. JC010 TaxID=2593641 RepID=UPI0013D1A06B|nr:sulfotransferase [Desulfovibrio sp. JC010]NDV26703.1 sulfotransferase [Desulfovibrio sp. JC010]
MRTMQKNRMFIFGPARSGTTLISNLLSQHVNLHILVDSMLYQKTKRAYEMLARKCSLDPKKPDVNVPLSYQQTKYIVSMVMFWLLDIQYDLPLRDGVYGSWLKTYRERVDPYPILQKAKTKPLTIRNLLDELWLQMAGELSEEITCYGEKTPSNTHCARWVLAAYPNAKTIMVVRNPYTNIASIYNRSIPQYDLPHAVHTYLKFYKTLLKIKDLPNVKVIHYEDIINNLVETGNEMFSFLGLSQHILEPIFEPVARVDYVGSEITKDKDNKLKQVFNAEQKKYIREHCGHIFDTFYPAEI